MEIQPALPVTMFLLLADNVKVEPLNYRWLWRATSFPWHVVQSCVQETILLHSFQLRNRQRLAFAFKDIGILSFTDDVLCMQFYRNCVTGLESKASWTALLNTASCSGFEGDAVTLGSLLKGEQPDGRWPACTWQASPTPFHVLTRTDFSIGKEVLF